MRAHERPRSARRLLAGGIDQPRVADEHASPPAHPATLGDHLAALQRPGEIEVEGGGEEKAIGHQAVAGVEGGIVHHLEVECAVGGGGGMVDAVINDESYPCKAFLDNLDRRFKQRVDGGMTIEGFERTERKSTRLNSSH